MHSTHTLKKLLTYALWALLDAFILASAITLVNAAKTGSVIFLIQSVPEIKMSLLLISMGIAALLFFGMFFFMDRVSRWITPFCILFFSVAVSLAANYTRPYFSLVMCGVAIASVLTIKGIFPDVQVKQLSGKRLYILVAALTVVMTAQVVFVCTARHWCYSSSTFDLGIFAQMYEYMAADLTQNTTLERNVLLSHFEVHFSPVYYLLLPFYMIFRSVEFLLTAQAVVCFSGIIPLLLLCKRWKYSETVTLVISLTFLLFPAFSGGLFYDFHENAFLVPLLLWLLYFLEKNSTVGIMVCALLILCVKEDAGLYVVFVAMYALLNKNINWFNSVMLLAIGAAGFIVVTSLVDSIGEGIKVSRYEIFLTSGQYSLTDVVVNVVKNPAFFFSKLLSEEKLLFLLQMLVPLMFLPLRTRRAADWMLVAPVVIVNLATDYVYQADIHYQYVFGTGVLLVFLCAKNIRYCKEKTKTAAAAAVAGAIILTGSMNGKYNYIDAYWKNRTDIVETDQTLAMIPDDAVVFSTTYFTPHLYRCKEVYMYPFVYVADSSIVPDYVVLDNRLGLLAEYDELYVYWIEMGYEVVGTEGYATVFKR